jgi:hypothetical protein
MAPSLQLMLLALAVSSAEGNARRCAAKLLLYWECLLEIFDKVETFRHQFEAEWRVTFSQI